MTILNFEFKAKTNNPEELENKLLQLKPHYVGEDRQIDTYFNVPSGRLKLREGNIENALIYYKRPDTAGAKQSEVLLYKHHPDKALKNILIETLGVKVVVEKRRRIYLIENVKFHFDILVGLGTFVEVEAIDKTGDIGKQKLQKQCREYAKFFGIKPGDYVRESYSDLVFVARSQ
ncbi:MAG: class IV adenylate cyclase [Bacteroidales bacterium]|nr:class IV adenylate cyclase [Bacteroidales bacterium]MDZ4203474.1 class IV adenylate cyclase [Bacteroidales bacterium]